MAILLRAKHWHLFILLFAIPMLTQQVVSFSYMGDMQAYMQEQFPKDPGEMQNFKLDFSAMFDMFANIFIISYSVFALSALVLYAWLISVTTYMWKKLPKGTIMHIAWYYGSVVIMIVSVVSVLVLSFQLMDQMAGMIPNEDFDMNPLIQYFSYLNPLMLLLLITALFKLRYTAKCLKSVEMGTEAKIGDYFVDMILFALNFIGVWFIQPRINAIYSSDNKPAEVIEQ